MSKSKSSQSSVTNNTTTNNVLDGGAIKASFDFAENMAEEGFESVNEAVKTAGNASVKAIDGNVEVSKAALNTVANISDMALDKFADVSNGSLDTLAALQNSQNSSNAQLLKGIQSTIKSTNTGGASDVLENQKISLIVIAVVIVIVAWLAFRKGK
ncbi:hypothetical protein [Vibrio sp. SCSIO 43137]|uniref:hypothetical protein n=1 Tax=Vibrio sp. SCSIO 43137 TaxID=3021011 RepID=UPI00230719FC|nr:hypothetical protein [Vibrio sp. SCSIO 43137]WCE29970.1 hypothetical protein PK654_01265 [Vibrio sp. SCSIO 43137]